VFSRPSLKFRTVGFPQYGFKLKFGHDFRRSAADLSQRPTCVRCRTSYTSPQFPPRSKAARRLPVVRSLTIQAALRSSCGNTSVQRPLAHLRVVLSHWVIAYYGLIRHSWPLRSTYQLLRAVFTRLVSFGLVPRSFPNLLYVTVPTCRLPYPGGPNGC
jgi:hypothetical protein